MQIEYLNNLVKVNELPSKYRKILNIYEEGTLRLATALVGSPSQDGEILKLYLKSQMSFLKRLKYKLEAESAFTITTTESSLQKFNLK